MYGWPSDRRLAFTCVHFFAYSRYSNIYIIYTIIYYYSINGRAQLDSRPAKPVILTDQCCILLLYAYVNVILHLGVYTGCLEFHVTMNGFSIFINERNTVKLPWLDKCSYYSMYNSKLTIIFCILSHIILNIRTFCHIPITLYINVFSNVFD